MRVPAGVLVPREAAFLLWGKVLARWARDNPADPYVRHLAPVLRAIAHEAAEHVEALTGGDADGPRARARQGCGDGSGSETMTVMQAAERLDRHPATVRRWAGNGKLPGATRHGRDWQIPAAAVAERKEQT